VLLTPIESFGVAAGFAGADSGATSVAGFVAELTAAAAEQQQINLLRPVAAGAQHHGGGHRRFALLVDDVRFWIHGSA